MHESAPSRRRLRWPAAGGAGVDLADEVGLALGLVHGVGGGIDDDLGRRARTGPAGQPGSVKLPPSSWSRAITSPSGASERCSSQPTWPPLPENLHLRHPSPPDVYRAGSPRGCMHGLGRSARPRSCLPCTGATQSRYAPLCTCATQSGCRGTTARSCGCRFEGLGGAPAEFAFDLAGVDGVAAVVAGAVGDVGDQAA